MYTTPAMMFTKLKLALVTSSIRMPITGPAASARPPTTMITDAVRHQWWRTSSPLRRSAPAVPVRSSCTTWPSSDQRTSSQIAIGIPTIVSSSTRMTTKAISTEPRSAGNRRNASRYACSALVFRPASMSAIACAVAA